jgi:hypothetical protein
MQIHRYYLALCLVCSLCFAQPSYAQNTQKEAEKNNLWVMWERSNSNETNAQFRSHLLLNVPPEQARSFFENLTPSAKVYGAANVAHETSPICLADQAKQEQPQMRMVDTLGMELADKIATLRGLDGVFVDFRAVRGPRTFTRDFGSEVHGYVVKALQNAGVPLLTKDEVDVTPGRPTLTLRYSVEVVGCKPWSLSLGLKQTSVLARDLSIMLEGTTWSSSARQSEEDVNFGALEALQKIVSAFASDYAKANSVTGLNAVVQAPAN